MKHGFFKIIMEKREKFGQKPCVMERLTVEIIKAKDNLWKRSVVSIMPETLLLYPAQQRLRLCCKL